MWNGRYEPEPAEIRGIVDRITFRDERSGYSVLAVRCGETGAVMTVVGVFPAVMQGETRDFEGEWVTHPQYGRQFKARTSTPVVPETADAIEAYLGSGAIKGIGRAMARRIVGFFGPRTLEIIEEEPERLAEVPGLGPKKASAIAEEIGKQRQLRKVMMFLAKIGVTPNCAAKIYQTYGDDAISIIKENPYRLADDVFGIGFKTADSIALKMGIDPASPDRVRAGIRYQLVELAEQGHTYYPAGMLCQAAAKLIGVDNAAVEACIKDLAGTGSIIVTPDPGSPIYLKWLYNAENEVAGRLTELARAEVTPPKVKAPLDRLLRRVEEGAGIKLTPVQRNAILSVASSGVLVLTGGPGTGKTTTVRGVVRMLEAMRLKVMLAAPTGRAAKRLEEATGREARTIHRLLEVSMENGFMRFQRNEDNPLDADAIVVDEVSMVDLPLMASLLKATRPGMRLLFVGDKDQLPSVGPGAVLRDIIASGAIPVVELTEIFRQARESLIVVNAHRVNNGEFPILKDFGNGSGEFMFIEEEDAGKIPGLIRELVTSRLPSSLGCNPVDDIQVLTPMRKTPSGVDSLNEILREAVNPPSPDKGELKLGTMAFRLGDKVMQVVNNYDKMVFNGDIGRISSIVPSRKLLVVRFPDADGPREIEYGEKDIDQLALAYAVSVHKSQGSEYPVVVMPVTMQHYVMLQRNLLYTGITRAKRAVVLVGTKRAIALAVRNDRSAVRFSGLAGRLRTLACARTH
ncbi:MAG TPA: ATP-dependent RecD-like DNA helicase [Firmicutes bacterium]|nr:ATP-dependent RecD-like DNA helicase [Bacillota bacterium]